MKKLAKPPKSYSLFTKRFPELERAWALMAEAGKKGPLDDKTQRLIKLAISVGAMREGAVHSSVRKAVAMGMKKAEIEQVVALSASTLGMPSAVAIYSWIQDELDGH